MTQKLSFKPNHGGSESLHPYCRQFFFLNEDLKKSVQISSCVKARHCDSCAMFLPPSAPHVQASTSSEKSM